MPHKDPETRRAYQREYQRRWNAANREKRAAIVRATDVKRASTPHRREQEATAARRAHLRQKVAVILMYGGACAFCGDGRLEVLQVDHIDGGGAEHRASITRYRNIYDFLARTEHRPDLYRLLCANCHHAWTQYGVAPGVLEYQPIEAWQALSAKRNRR